MIIGICYFTNQGEMICNKIEQALTQDLIIKKQNESTKEFVKYCLERHMPLIMIGACGIAVRMIAPFVENKLEDSPVVVIDETACYVIPILSGHMGGANALANWLAKILDAQAVITTATDLQGKFSVDLFAKYNHLHIENKDGIARVSDKILKNEQVSICIADEITYEKNNLPDELFFVNYPPKTEVDILVVRTKTSKYNCKLMLTTKEYVVGLGCKKGKTFEELKEFLRKQIFIFKKEQKKEIAIHQIYGLSSIDIKQKEQGILELCSFFHIPFYTYSAEELKKAKGEFLASEFVNKTVGVDNVCERSASILANNAKLLVHKQTQEGMSFAMAYKKPEIFVWKIEASGNTIREAFGIERNLRK